MRIRYRKSAWKKMGAFLLAFILAVPVTGGFPATVGAAAFEPDYKGGDYLELVVDQSDGKETTDGDTKYSLEEGDELKLIIKTVSGQTLKNVTYLKGLLAFEDGAGNDIGECFKEIKANDYEGCNVSVQKAGRYHEFTLTSASGSTVTIPENTPFLEIELRVARAVDKDLCIKFQGKDPEKGNCFEIKKSAFNPKYYSPINTTITNRWYGKRKLSFTVAGNSEGTDNSSIDVPVKNTKTKKTKIAVQINKENGTDRGTGKPGYSAFTLTCTYNPSVLTLETNKDGSYCELSKAAKEYKDRKGLIITSYPTYNVTGGKRVVTMTLSSNTGEDIGVYGDFLYLAFVPAGNHELGLQPHEADVEVTVKGGTNFAFTTMTTEVSDGVPYLDKDNNVLGGTKTFRVNFVPWLIRFGDVNNDSYINLIDATMVLQYYNGIKTLTTEEMERANADDSVDANGEPTIDLKDVMFIMKYVNGEITELPVTTS